MKLKMSYYTIVSKPFTEGNDKGVRYLFSARTGKTLRVKKVLYNYLLNGDLTILPDNLLRILLNYSILVPQNENELDFIVKRSQAAIADKDYVRSLVLNLNLVQHQTIPSAWLDELEALTQKHKPGAKLNLSFILSEKKNSLDTVKGYLELIEARKWNYDITLLIQQTVNGNSLAGLAELEAVKRVDLILTDIEGDEAERKQAFRCFTKVTAIIDAFRKRIDFRAIIQVDLSDETAVDYWVNQCVEHGYQQHNNIFITPLNTGMNGKRQKMNFHKYLKAELALLVNLKSLGFTTHIMPSQAATKTGTCVTGFLGQARSKPKGMELIDSDGYFDKEDLGWNNQSRNRAIKTYQPENFTEQIMSRETPCSHCRFLPVCGGFDSKAWKKGVARCPSYKYSLSQRIKILSN